MKDEHGRLALIKALLANDEWNIWLKALAKKPKLSQWEKTFVDKLMQGEAVFFNDPQGEEFVFFNDPKGEELVFSNEKLEALITKIENERKAK